MAKPNKKTQEYLDSEEYRDLRAEMLDQLIRNGTDGKVYEDLVDDYMAFWVDRQLLTDDIQHRGVVVSYNNGGGQKGKKKNDSITDKIKVSSQMLSILNTLGIRVEQDNDPDDEEL